MARPQRNTVDYFPFYCEDGNKMFYLEETYGNDGFAVFVKLLRELARTDYHYLDLSKNTTVMFLSAKCKVSKEVLINIVKDLVELEKFDYELWNEAQIIWCESFIESIQDAYRKRANNCIDKNQLIQLLISKGILKPSKGRKKPSKGSSEGGVKPQIKEEYKREEEIKEENKREFFRNWIDYRIELKKPVKADKTITSLINKFNENSYDCCKWVVNNSIENQYQGLFWQNYKPQQSNNNDYPNGRRIAI